MDYTVLIFALAYLLLRFIAAVKANDLVTAIVTGLAIVVILIHAGLRALKP